MDIISRGSSCCQFNKCRENLSVEDDGFSGLIVSGGTINGLPFTYGEMQVVKSDLKNAGYDVVISQSNGGSSSAQVEQARVAVAQPQERLIQIIMIRVSQPQMAGRKCRSPMCFLTDQILRFIISITRSAKNHMI